MKKDKDTEVIEQDNIIYFNGSEEVKEENNKLKKRIRNRKIVLIALLFVCLAGLGVVYYILTHKTYTSYRVVATKEISRESNATYLEFGSGMLEYTNEGVTYINSSGKVEWKSGIACTKPTAAVNGRYGAIADISGKNLYVFDIAGEVTSVSLPYSLVDLSVASQGSVVVILENDETNFINCYSKSGEKIYEIQTTFSKSGYPMDIDVSGDGEQLVASFIQIEGVTYKSRVVVYDFGTQGKQASADRIIGEFEYADEIISKVKILDSKSAALYGTHTLATIKLGSAPSKRAEVNIDKKIHAVFSNKKYIGIIVENPEIEDAYELCVYNLDCNEKFTEGFNFEYENIYTSSKEIIVTGGINALVYRLNGTVKFEGTFDEQIESLVPVERKRNQYTVAYSDREEVIKLVTKKKEKAKSSGTSDYSTEDEIDSHKELINTNTDIEDAGDE